MKVVHPPGHYKYPTINMKTLEEVTRSLDVTVVEHQTQPQ